jgi:hypothetical protein
MLQLFSCLNDGVFNTAVYVKSSQFIIPKLSETNGFS